LAGIIAERYALVEYRGDNGLFRSYLVEDLLLQRRAFMKVYPRLEGIGLEYLKAVTLARETGIPGLLLPEEAGILDGEDDEVLVYALFPELNEPSLGRYLALGFHLGGSEALGIARKILECLEELHGRGYLHLFLNPRNVLYHPSGEVLLKDACLRGDFFPEVLERLPRPDISFFSPRLMDGGEPRASDDLYAAGLFFRWMSGHLSPGPEKLLLEQLSDFCLSSGDDGDILAGSARHARELLDARAWSGRGSGVGGRGSAKDGASPSGQPPGEGACKGNPCGDDGYIRPICSWEEGASSHRDHGNPRLAAPRAEEETGDGGTAPGAMAFSGLPVGKTESRLRWPTLGRALLIALLASSAMAIFLVLGLFHRSGAARREPARLSAGAKDPLVSASLEVAAEGEGLPPRPGDVDPGIGGRPVDDGCLTGSQAQSADPAVPVISGAAGDKARCGEEDPLVSQGPVPNQPPVASFTLEPSRGASPLRVLCDASGSYDPDGSIVSWRWSFGMEGKRVYWMAESQVLPARIPVTLTVADDAGAVATATKFVTLF
jgi:hypothetical protein